MKHPRNDEIREKRGQCERLNRQCKTLKANVKTFDDMTRADDCKADLHKQDCLKYLASGGRKRKRKSKSLKSRKRRSTGSKVRRSRKSGKKSKGRLTFKKKKSRLVFRKKSSKQ